jgi:hypothetical protein
VIISIHNALLGLAMVASGALTESLGARWTYGLAAAFTAASALTALALARGVESTPALAGETA